MDREQVARRFTIYEALWVMGYSAKCLESRLQAARVNAELQTKMTRCHFLGVGR
jgi:hypothetical protein